MNKNVLMHYTLEESENVIRFSRGLFVNIVALHGDYMR